MGIPTIGKGRFAVLATIGRGGQAVVLRAHDRRLGTDRALKVLLPEFASRSKIQARFVEEARSMAALEHPNVARVYDVNTDDALPFIVMEVLPGGSLGDWLEAEGPFPPRQAVELGRQICAGLGAAHARGIVHRDLKPGNVLVAAAGTVRVTDFGIARMIDRTMTQTGAQLGTLGYMAPEHARDATLATPRSDQYSIAVTLFVLLTKRDPHDWMVEEGLDEVPAPLLEVLRKATAKRPEQRYASADELSAALAAAAGSLPPDPRRIPLGPRRSAAVTLDLTDIQTLLDRPDTPESRTPRPLPYRMPTQDLARRRVDSGWTETPAPAVPRGFVVDLDEEERTRSREARERRATMVRSHTPPSIEERVGSDLGVSDVGSFAREVLEVVLRGVLRLQIVPISFGLFALAAAVELKVRWDRSQVEEALAARHDALEARIQAARPVLDELDRAGADGDTLQALYSKWQYAQEPERTQAALSLAEEVDREARRVYVDGVDIEQIRQATEDYKQAVRAGGN